MINASEPLKKAFYTPPETEQQLKDWIHFFLDFEVHDSVRCNNIHIEGEETHHNSQFDYIKGGFFGEYSSCVFLASRNAGKSFAASILCLLDCLFKPDIKIAVAAFQRNQSDYIYKYMISFIETLNEKMGVQVVTKRSSKRDIIKSSITDIDIARSAPNDIYFYNKSSVKFFSGGASQAGIKGYHPNILIVDECDLFNSSQFDGLANALEAGGKHQRRMDVLSTNYTVSGDGVVLKQIERYKEFNKNPIEGVLPTRIFKVCLIDILEKCPDKYLCFNEKTGVPCPLWNYCKGTAKQGNGFYKISSAFETMRDSSRQNFESQMLLLRPSSDVAYFNNFDLSKNIIDPDMELNPDYLSFVAFDFGGSQCPNAALIAQKDKNGVFYFIDEFSALGNLEILLDKLKAKYPIATSFDCFCDPKGSYSVDVQGNISPVQCLKNNRYRPRHKHILRDTSAQNICRLISTADGKIKFRVNKRCKTLLSQIYAAECKIGKNKKPTAELADYGHDDFLDLARYITSWAIRDDYVPLGRQNARRYF